MLLLDVPHRQVVFTIPKRLRVFFKFKRRLLGELCRLALRALSRYFELVAGSELMPGVVAAIQTFGDRMNLHPHLHFLVTEGGADEAGVFHLVPRIDDSRLEEIFAREVLAFLVRRELLSPDKGQVTVRYYGLYANAHRGKLRKASLWPFPLRMVVDRIIDHLKLTFVADRPPPPQRAYQEVLMAAEEYFS